MKSKKTVIIIAIICLVILAILFATFKIYNSYMFNDDGTLSDAHTQVIEYLKNVEDKEERKKQIDFSVESNIITQEEADELY